MPISEKTYRLVALEDPTGRWELSCGQLRSKPAMTSAHEHTFELLAQALRDRIDQRDYIVRTDGPRLRTSAGNFYLPDDCVYPRRLLERAFRDNPRGFLLYEEPMPFVAEVWSQATGNYDVATKIPEYQRRGDLEIWLLHPYDKTVRRWVRRSDGDYEETLIREGNVRLAALPGVQIDLDTLFD